MKIKEIIKLENIIAIDDNNLLIPSKSILIIKEENKLTILDLDKNTYYKYNSFITGINTKKKIVYKENTNE